MPDANEDLSHHEICTILQGCIDQARTRADTDRNASMSQDAILEHERTAQALQRVLSLIGEPVPSEEITEDTIITGAEWRDFYQNNWPGKDWYIDDMCVPFEDEFGKYVLDDASRHRLGDFGVLGWQGSTDQHPTGTFFPVSEFFAAYKGARKDEIVSFLVPSDTLVDLMDAAASLGARPVV